MLVRPYRLAAQHAITETLDEISAATVVGTYRDAGESVSPVIGVLDSILTQTDNTKLQLRTINILSSYSLLVPQLVVRRLSVPEICDVIAATLLDHSEQEMGPETNQRTWRMSDESGEYRLAGFQLLATVAAVWPDMIPASDAVGTVLRKGGKSLADRDLSPRHTNEPYAPLRALSVYISSQTESHAIDFPDRTVELSGRLSSGDFTDAINEVDRRSYRRTLGRLTSITRDLTDPEHPIDRAILRFRSGSLSESIALEVVGILCRVEGTGASNSVLENAIERLSERFRMLSGPNQVQIARLLGELYLLNKESIADSDVISSPVSGVGVETCDYQYEVNDSRDHVRAIGYVIAYREFLEDSPDQFADELDTTGDVSGAYAAQALGEVVVNGVVDASADFTEIRDSIGTLSGDERREVVRNLGHGIGRVGFQSGGSFNDALHEYLQTSTGEERQRTARALGTYLALGREGYDQITHDLIERIRSGEAADPQRLRESLGEYSEHRRKQSIEGPDAAMRQLRYQVREQIHHGRATGTLGLGSSARILGEIVLASEASHPSDNVHSLTEHIRTSVEITSSDRTVLWNLSPRAIAVRGLGFVSAFGGNIIAGIQELDTQFQDPRERTAAVEALGWLLAQEETDKDENVPGAVGLKQNIKQGDDPAKVCDAALTLGLLWLQANRSDSDSATADLIEQVTGRSPGNELLEPNLRWLRVLEMIIKHVDTTPREAISELVRPALHIDDAGVILQELLATGAIEPREIADILAARWPMPRWVAGNSSGTEIPVPFLTALREATTTAPDVFEQTSVDEPFEGNEESVSLATSLRRWHETQLRAQEPESERRVAIVSLLLALPEAEE